MSKSEKPQKVARNPKFWEACIPIVFLIVTVLLASLRWGFDPHIPIILTDIVIILVAMWCGHDINKIVAAGMDSVKSAAEAIVIIMCVGILIATWIYAGTMPAMVYYGLKLLTPAMFLPLGCFICFLVAVMAGSSWTAAGTVGVAFMGIAAGLGIDPALAAGMVVSGAYAGDKLSPLSDTTNLAAAGANVPLYEHVKGMVSTTLPSGIIAIALYLVVGLVVGDSSGYDPSVVQGILTALDNTFVMSPLLLLPILVILWGALKKIPAIPTMLLASAIAVFMGVFVQHFDWITIMNAAEGGAAFETGDAYADGVLNRGGFMSMMWTAALIMFTLFFGGVLQGCGFVDALLGGIVGRIKRVGSLVAATVLTGIACDFLLAGQYLAILVPAKLFAEKFDEMGLSRKLLSRSCEDGGTLWSAMVPWAGCGAYMQGTLGVSPFAYLPYTFYTLLNPIIAIVMAYMGKGIFWAEEDGKTKEEIKALRAARKAAK